MKGIRKHPAPSSANGTGSNPGDKWGVGKGQLQLSSALGSGLSHNFITTMLFTHRGFDKLKLMHI